MKNFPWRPFALTFWALALILIFNRDFDTLTTTAGQMGANDVASIVDGFHRTPHFWSDFWVWWHGPWIQSGVQVFRPLSSMMLWWECFIGLNYGFITIAWRALVADYRQVGGARFIVKLAARDAAGWLPAKFVELERAAPAEKTNVG